MALAIAFACAASPARADVPPPPGYVEQCTIEKQCGKAEEGDYCHAWHGDPDACSKKHAGDGFVHKCRTRGASVWNEVWCGPKEHKKPDPKKPEKKAP